MTMAKCLSYYLEHMIPITSSVLSFMMFTGLILAMMVIMSFSNKLESIVVIYFFVLPPYVVNVIQLPLILFTTIRGGTGNDNPQVVRVPFRLHMVTDEDPPSLPDVNIIPPTPSVLSASVGSHHAGQPRKPGKGIFSDNMLSLDQF